MSTLWKVSGVNSSGPWIVYVNHNDPSKAFFLAIQKKSFSIFDEVKLLAIQDFIDGGETEPEARPTQP